MKRTAVLLMVMMLIALTSVALARDEGVGRLGELLLYQKCDDSLKLNPPETYDAFGCPLSENGPWPIFLGNHRWGRMHYNLWGEKFAFAFEGRRLLPRENYTLIYYSDPWPGDYLICLGEGKTNRAGNLMTHGKKEIGTGSARSG